MEKIAARLRSMIPSDERCCGEAPESTGVPESPGNGVVCNIMLGQRLSLATSSCLDIFNLHCK